jgi:hypothetical protein
MTTDDCACRVDNGAFVFCPMHKAAPALLRALKECANRLDLASANSRTPVNRDGYARIAERARVVIAEAYTAPLRCGRCGGSPHLFTDEKCEAPK